MSVWCRFIIIIKIHTYSEQLSTVNDHAIQREFVTASILYYIIIYNNTVLYMEPIDFTFETIASTPSDDCAADICFENHLWRR